MSEALGPRLAVRGVASRFVAPDAAQVSATITVERDTREQAAHDAGAVARQVSAGLTELGGEVRTPDNHRHPLTWLMPRVRTFERFERDKNGVRHHRGFGSQTQVTIWVRDLALIGRLVGMLSATTNVNVSYIYWLVDDDNPGWTVVRADAITAAVARARDYAAALGAELASVDEIADVGLLGGDVRASGPREAAYDFSAAALGAAAPAEEDLSLDPEPRELHATIEARFRATPVTLSR